MFTDTRRFRRGADESGATAGSSGHRPFHWESHCVRLGLPSPWWGLSRSDGHPDPADPRVSTGTGGDWPIHTSFFLDVLISSSLSLFLPKCFWMTRKKKNTQHREHSSVTTQSTCALWQRQTWARQVARQHHSGPLLSLPGYAEPQSHRTFTSCFEKELSPHSV